MSKAEPNKWLKENGLRMLIFFASAIFGAGVGITAFQSQARANTEDIKELREELAEYPSKDWFVLRFQYIDERITDLEEKLD